MSQYSFSQQEKSLFKQTSQYVPSTAPVFQTKTPPRDGLVVNISAVGHGLEPQSGHI